jgi:hypothetical protein
MNSNYPEPTSEQRYRFGLEFEEFQREHIGMLMLDKDIWYHARAYGEEKQGLTPMELPE